MIFTKETTRDFKTPLFQLQNKVELNSEFEQGVYRYEDQGS